VGHIFISHVGEDEAAAVALARGLEAEGFKTWYYERDSLPGASYLVQTGQAVEDSSAVLVLVSPQSIVSHQVTKEVVRAHEAAKPFLPVLHGISHADFQKRQPEWREAMGSAASVQFPAEGAAAILPRLVAGLSALKVERAARVAAAGPDVGAASAPPAAAAPAAAGPALYLKMKPQVIAVFTGVPFGAAMAAFIAWQAPWARHHDMLLWGVFLFAAAFFGGAMGAFSYVSNRQGEKAVPPDLEPEGLVAYGPANHFLSGESRGGFLYLTRRRLLFVSHAMNLQGETIDIPLDRVTACDEHQTLGLLPNGLLVKLESGVTHRFAVSQRHRWLETLYELRRR
jgi:hypothetical protein